MNIYYKFNNYAAKQIIDIFFAKLSIIVSVKANAKTTIMSFGSGVFVGVVNGLLGAGGGMLVVPIYEHLYSLPSKKAHATAILTILPISAISAISYIAHGAVKLEPLFLVMAGSIAGGLFGTFLLSKLKSTIITILFYLAMFVCGLLMILLI